jgi:hypothetical protein
MSEDISKRLSQLPPDARARVEEALKANIETELAASAATPALRPVGDFSRGIIFSKVVYHNVMLENVVSQAALMDEATFNAFAQRLAQIRDIQSTGGTQ